MGSSNSVLAGPKDPIRSGSASSLREKLVSLFGKVKLPSSPVLATKILELTQNEDASAEDFAQLIQMDGALAARLLKMSNAASLGQRTPVTTLHKAVTVLGIARVRTAALGFQLVGHLNKLGNYPFDMARYWQHALLRGCVARELARIVVPKLAEEAFLVGLLQDTGILLLIQILGKEYADLFAKFGQDHVIFYQAERRSAAHTHVEASAAIAQEWKLPDVIAQPIATHHTPVPINVERDKLAGVAYLVGSMRFAQHEISGNSADPAREYAIQTLRLDDAAFQRAFADAAKCYEQMAELLGDDLPEGVDVTELLSQANAQLTTVAGQAEEKVTTAVAERNELEARQAELTSVLGEVKKRASCDPLTGTLNRGALSEAAAECLRRSREARSTLSVAFLDVDNFKKLNDTFGHKTGDEVLKNVAVAIAGLGRDPGCSGRYGGEEFIVMVPGLDEAGARLFGESVCEAIRGIGFRGLGLSGPVTASVGVAHGVPTSMMTVDEAFGAADRLMYQAKKSGKNRSVVGGLVVQPESGSPTPFSTGSAAVEPALIAAVALQMNETEAPVADNMRAERREKVAMVCKVATFTENFQTRSETGCVRNLSAGGMSLLMSRAVAEGQPVEAAIHLPDKSVVYMAGVVSHNRMVRANVHEVGIKVSTTSRQPIFSANPASALVNLPWLAEALRSGKCGR
ncbi:MAG: GGDEF domain-containing protein [Planctomycetes bacterium]|nr:GGDEF domain-containing protein [Planctomycetota bacterium]